MAETKKAPVKRAAAKKPAAKPKIRSPFEEAVEAARTREELVEALAKLEASKGA
jgi:hypothetical protein